MPKSSAKRKRQSGRWLPLFVLPALLITSLELAGCAVVPSTSPAVGGGPNPPTATPEAQLTLCDDSTPGCLAETSFSLAKVRDLDVQVAWSNVGAGNHVQQVDFLLPNQGGLFQTTQTAFVIPGSVPGSLSTSRMFPVGGTAISQRQMTGSWTIQVSLDGQVIVSQAVEFNP